MGRLGLVAFGLAVLLGPGAAAAATPGIFDVSPNWSGYVAVSPESSATPVSFTRVAGTWQVPRVHCVGSAGAASAQWVGLGGYHGATPGQKLEQIGTDANCDKSGAPVYYGWFEVVPYPAYTIDKTVLAGDTISASVNILPNIVELQLKNRTRGWSFTRKITWISPDTSSAEWIVEAPSTCVRFDCAQAPLANFGSVTMTRLAAVGNSSPGTLSTPAWTLLPVKLVPSSTPTTFNLGSAGPPGAPGGLGGSPSATKPNAPSSPAGAAPGATSPDGRSFTISWVPVATGY